MLTRKNFNSEVPYESNREKPFRFGNFTTMGEFYIETGLSTVNMSDYKRILSLDSALAVVQFKKDDVAYERDYFISYPANVMAIRFKADRPGKQNLTFSYSPIRYRQEACRQTVPTASHTLPTSTITACNM